MVNSKCALVVGGLLLSACQSQESAETRGTAVAEPSVVLAEVRSGQWQAYRRNLTNALAEGNAIDIGVAVTPGSGAKPFIVFMASVTLSDGTSSPVTPIFLALPENEPIGSIIHVEGSDDAEIAAQIELGLVFGSRDGPATFRVGEVSPGISDEEVLSELASRPSESGTFAQGEGGAAGSYIRLVADDGSVRTINEGLMSVEESVLAALPDNASLLHQTTLAAGELVNEPVVVTATLLGLPQSGVSDWEYEMYLPPYQLADQGQFLAVGGAPPPVGVSTLGLAPMAFFILAHAEAGDLSLNVRYRYSGQEHSTVADQLTVADGGLVFTWGYLPRNALEVFGWNISEILPGQ